MHKLQQHVEKKRPSGLCSSQRSTHMKHSNAGVGVSLLCHTVITHLLLLLSSPL
jgi:hypothetical protein